MKNSHLLKTKISGSPGLNGSIYFNPISVAAGNFTVLTRNATMKKTLRIYCSWSEIKGTDKRPIIDPNMNFSLSQPSHFLFL